MAIFVNESGVLKELSEVNVNEGGVLYNLDKIHSNEGGVLCEIFGSLPQNISGTGRAPSAPDFKIATSFELTSSARVTVIVEHDNSGFDYNDEDNWSAIVQIAFHLDNADHTVLSQGWKSINSSYMEAAQLSGSAVLSAGRYYLYVGMFTASGSPSGVSYTGQPYRYQVTFSKA